MTEDELTMWIGRVARAAGDLEYAAGALLAALIDSPPAGNIVAFGQPFLGSMDTVRAIVDNQNAVQRMEPDLPPAIRRAVSEARAAWGRRNLIVHGLWLGSNDDAHVVLLERRNDRSVAERIAESDLRETRDALEAVSATIKDLIRRVAGVS